MVYLDLEELPELFDARWLWSARGPAIAWFRRRDHLGDPHVPLADEVRRLVLERTGSSPDGPIRLLTHLRYFGHCFNPVSFYYCHERSDGRVSAVVAHVTNTPWGESHSYVMPVTDTADHGTAALIEGRVEKCLHVSPLMGMDHVYDWRLTEPGERLSVHIESLDADGESVFDATLALRRREMTAGAMRLRSRALPIADDADRRSHLRARGAAEAAGRELLPASQPRGGVGVSAAAETSSAGMLATSSDPAASGPLGAISNRVARRAVLRLFRRLHGGQLEILEGERSLLFGELVGERPLRAVVHVRSARFYRSLLRGSVGLCESYVDGLWECEDLVALTRIAALNVGALDRLRRVLAPALIPVQRWARWLVRNTPHRSRRRIAAHYDLGNELFALFLDPTMMYSCAVFERPDATLQEASLAKLERVCEKLALGPNDHVLEIGTGWGGFAVYAAQTRGCRVTTTTISREQHAYALERVRAAGLDDCVTVLLEDYRELSGSYDKLVSIEMIEAVGWRYFPTFFRRCSELLKPDGAMLLQAIVIEDDAYEVEKAGKSFINTYIFPGGCLPSLDVIARTVARASDLRQIDLEDITAHYATTLAHWRERFLASAERIGELGYDERFRRLWELYLSYCEGGFRERRIQDVQLLLAKPGHHAEPAPVVSLAA